MDNNTTMLLQQLATKLGTTVEQLWAILLAGQRTTAMVDFALAFFSLLALGICLFLGHKCWQKISGCGYIDDVPFIILLSALIVATFFLMIAAPVNFFNGLELILNPQYAALHEIMRLLK